MADATVLREYLATLGYRVDEASQRRFIDAVGSMSKTVLGLSAGLTAAASAVTAAVASMASSGEHMYYASQRIGDSVTNVDKLTFALSKMGLQPQQTISALTSLADNLRNNPGLRSIWAGLTGSETVTAESVENLRKRYATMGVEAQRYYRQIFSSLPPEFWLAIGRPGLEQGEQEFTAVNRLFQFDPDAFARQSVLLQNAWRSLGLRLNTIWEGIAERLMVSMQRAYEGITQFIDVHHDDINRIVDKTFEEYDKVSKGIVDLATAIYNWWNRLSHSSAEVIAAIGLVGAAFGSGGWLKLAGIAILLERLLNDYETFKQTGKSPLDIPWENIGQGIDYVTKKIGELNDATGGFITPWHAFEAYLAGRFLFTVGGVFLSIASGARATGAVVTASLTGGFSALSGLLRGILGLAARLGVLGAAGGAYLGLTSGANPIAPQGQENEQLGGSFAQRFPNLVTNRPTTEQTPNQAQLQGQPSGGGGSIWDKLWNVLSYLNPISTAKADELPDNVKQLSTRVDDLNKTLGDMLDQQQLATLFGNVGTNVGGIGGGGGSGGTGKVNLNDPKVVEAVKYLMSKGVPMPQAIGMVANFLAESSLSTDVVNPTGHAGIAQWDRGRQQQFRLMFGHDVTQGSLQEQLDFSLWELQHTEKAAGSDLAQQFTPGGAANSFNRNFERSDDATMRRSQIADAISRNPQLTSNNVAQTNNVTINTTADPNAIVSAYDQQNQRQWQDLQRHLSTAVQ